MPAIDEAAAEAIYDLFPYDGQGKKPAWVPQGNSLMQDRARSYAKAAKPFIERALLKAMLESYERKVYARSGREFIREIARDLGYDMGK